MLQKLKNTINLKKEEKFGVMEIKLFTYQHLYQIEIIELFNI